MLVNMFLVNINRLGKAQRQLLDDGDFKVSSKLPPEASPAAFSVICSARDKESGNSWSIPAMFLSCSRLLASSIDSLKFDAFVNSMPLS